MNHGVLVAVEVRHDLRDAARHGFDGRNAERFLDIVARRDEEIGRGEEQVSQPCGKVEHDADVGFDPQGASVIDDPRTL